MLKVVKASEFEDWKAAHQDYELIDVREEYEFEDLNIGGLNIPLNEVIAKRMSIPSDKAVMFCCRTGKRSAAIVSTLQRKFGMDNIYSLQGGIEAQFQESH